MKTIKYKTIERLLRQTKQLTVEQFLNGRFHHNTKGWICFTLEDEERDRVYNAIANYCYSTDARRKRMFKNLSYNLGDPSYLQCFYINNKNGILYIDNSLSGESFNYCVRMYNK